MTPHHVVRDILTPSSSHGERFQYISTQSTTKNIGVVLVQYQQFDAHSQGSSGVSRCRPQAYADATSVLKRGTCHLKLHLQGFVRSVQQLEVKTFGPVDIVRWLVGFGGFSSAPVQ